MLRTGRVIHSHKDTEELKNKAKLVYTEKAERLELRVSLPHPEGPRRAPRRVADVDSVGSTTSKEDATSGPGTRLDHSRALV